MELGTSQEPTGCVPLDVFPAFNRTRKFNTAFTKALHFSLFCATPIQSTPPYRISATSILMLLTHLLVRFEVFTAVTMKNGVFWDVNAVWLL
jgi:hypothetical protein